MESPSKQYYCFSQHFLKAGGIRCTSRWSAELVASSMHDNSQQDVPEQHGALLAKSNLPLELGRGSYKICNANLEATTVHVARRLLRLARSGYFC